MTLLPDLTTCFSPQIRRRWCYSWPWAWTRPRSSRRCHRGYDSWRCCRRRRRRRCYYACWWCWWCTNDDADQKRATEETTSHQSRQSPDGARESAAREHGSPGCQTHQLPGLMRKSTSPLLRTSPTTSAVRDAVHHFLRVSCLLAGWPLVFLYQKAQCHPVRLLHYKLPTFLPRFFSSSFLAPASEARALLFLFQLCWLY